MTSVSVRLVDYLGPPLFKRGGKTTIILYYMHAAHCRVASTIMLYCNKTTVPISLITNNRYCTKTPLRLRKEGNSQNAHVCMVDIMNTSLGPPFRFNSAMGDPQVEHRRKYTTCAHTVMSKIRACKKRHCVRNENKSERACMHGRHNTSLASPQSRPG